MLEILKPYAERTVLAHEELLGTIIAYPDRFQDYKHQLEPELFYSYDWLYQIILNTEAAEGLTYRGIINRCTTAQIKTIQMLRAHGYNERRYSDLIKQAKKDLLNDRLRQLSHDIEQTESDPDELLRQVQSKVNEYMTSESSDMSNPEKDVDDYYEHMLEIVKDPSRALGMMTGVDEIDRITTGYQRQDFSVVGARTSMGKSAFMIDTVLRINRHGYSVAVFSLEMSKKQIYNRMCSNMLNTNLERYRTGRGHPSEYEAMKTRKEELKSIYISDLRGIDCEYISDVVRRLKRTQGVDMVVVDYLQDVKERGENNDNQGSAIGRICRKLRRIAQEFDCHVMGLSQVTRGAEASTDKRPGNADLAGSTGIETSADVIMLLYREDHYKPDTLKQNILEVNFTKQRNGKVGKVELHYDRDTQRISSLRGY